MAGHLTIDLFQTRYDAGHDYSLQFDSGLNGLEVHSRSQGHGKDDLCDHSVVKFHAAT